MAGVDQSRGAMHLVHPVGELVAVGQRGREGNKLDVGRAVDDRLFPDGASLLVVHVVAFVQDHRLHVLQGIPAQGLRLLPRIHLAGVSPLLDSQRKRRAVEHVAEDLGGHHQDGRLPVDGDVAGEQANPLWAKLLAEIAKLLVGKSLQRSCIKNPLALGQGPINSIFSDQRLAGSRRCTDYHRFPSC